ncbi:MAG: TPM domain-containing protein [Marinoscillum sp.]
MIRSKTYLIWLLLLFSCNPSRSAKQFPSEESLPKLYSRVNDYADILNPKEEMELNELLESLEDSVGSQLVILTIKSLEGEKIESYSMRIANEWKIGRASHNDGIIVTLAMQDQKIRIEVGYGLELIVKDEIAKAIITEIMVPQFRQDSFSLGLKNASQEMIRLIYDQKDLIGKSPY